ncbi:MAG: prepilin-type N-terminal cleavage/methylation domain-containing protein [Armatimonadetes bacterium]|nr:prepilin-type N-terminal cleavage/methylation domain-containing protein [Armatimonadota bacterium]
MPRRRAFTIVELLVVIAIIAILAALLFPVFLRAKEAATKVVCFSNMRQLGMAVSMYADAHSGGQANLNRSSPAIRRRATTRGS